MELAKILLLTMSVLDLQMMNANARMHAAYAVLPAHCMWDVTKRRAVAPCHP